MTHEPLVVSQSSAGDRLAGVLQAHLALEDARRRRSWRVHLTALLSLPVASAALWPALLSDVGRRAVLTFWGLSAAAALRALVAEWRARLHLSA